LRQRRRTRKTAHSTKQIQFTKERAMKDKLSAWESQARSVARIIVGFLITLHGFRNAFNMLAARAGRRGAPPMALDMLGPIGGYLEIAGGALLMLGLLTIPAAILLCLLSAVAYVVGPMSRPSPLPLRNGGEEAVIYFVSTIYFALAGAGAWSIDALLRRNRASTEAQAA
jgi:putative oxidoreductase